ncbi:hypothetical protein IAR55_003962 [Kwoniella newhampshirensis]|uniref:DNA endonuclease activator Ctp1 C-terminal domain-containing protein n=1 Tax=Kwoniella newhampshirensis TaxID=1651941 RepID=A0AAW0Z185_9TREE
MAFFGDLSVEEESLGSGIERQMAKFDELRDCLNGMTTELSKLKNQCDAYKTKRQSLETDIHNLNSQIQQLVTDRDALRIEYTNVREANEWWSERDRSVSASAPAHVHEVDVLGKLNRRNWLLEEQVKELRAQIEETRKTDVAAIESERAISAGLRDRIGKLEERIRKQRTEKEDLEKREKNMKIALYNVADMRRGDEERWKMHNNDLTESLSKERVENERLKEEMEKSRAEKERAQSEVRKMREEGEGAVKSPSRVLQTLQPNIPFASLSPCPTTPTKHQQRMFSPLLDTPTRQRPSSPTVSLTLKYAHLEQTHRELKSAYDKLRETYNRDKKYMMEYKAVVMAREEVKKERREEKKAKKQASRSGSSSASNPFAAAVSGQTEQVTTSGETVKAATLTIKNPEVLVEESESQHGDTKEQSHRGTSVTLHQDEDEVVALEDVRAIYTDDEAVFGSQAVGIHNDAKCQQDRQNDNSPLMRHTSHSALTRAVNLTNRRALTISDSHGAIAHDPVDSSTSGITTVVDEIKRVVCASRITPWLGVSPEKSGKPSSTRKLRSNKSRNKEIDRDDFRSPPDDSPVNTPTTNRKRLVRDRLGDSAARSASLRKVAIQNNAEGEETPLRPRADNTQSLKDGSSSATPDTMTSGKKRKAVDMEGLTPAQKALQLKKISKLPASEKREIYASYKKGGRYNAPEEIQTAIRDEYEIDPEQNEGASFAFHDVKRKKAERKGLHGGDCECCKGYYEAVGEIPRYNQGPVWKDPEVVEGTAAEGDWVREHQNKVSRHRETWTKPPTPPGYWKIGFPNTQDVAEQNEAADRMLRDKEERTRREVLQKDSKWRKKVKD